MTEPGAGGEARRIFPNIVTFRFGDFRGDPTPEPDPLAKGLFRFGFVGGGLEPPAPLEPALTPPEAEAYAALVAAWAPRHAEWYRAVRGEGPRPLVELRRELFYTLRVRMAAELGTLELVGETCPYEVFPALVTEPDEPTEAVFKLLYVRRRWILAAGDLNRCVDEPGLTESGNTCLFLQAFDPEFLASPLGAPGAPGAAAEDTPGAAAPGAPGAAAEDDLRRRVRELLADWARGVRKEELEFARGLSQDPAVSVYQATPPLEWPPLLSAKSVLRCCAQAMAKHPFLEFAEGVQVPRFVNERNPRFRVLQESAFRNNPVLPEFITGVAARRSYTLWETRVVPHAVLLAWGVDAVLAALNPPALFERPPSAW